MRLVPGRWLIIKLIIELQLAHGARKRTHARRTLCPRAPLCITFWVRVAVDGRELSLKRVREKHAFADFYALLLPYAHVCLAHGARSIWPRSPVNDAFRKRRNENVPIERHLIFDSGSSLIAVEYRMNIALIVVVIGPCCLYKRAKEKRGD